MPDPPPGLEREPVADGLTFDRWLGGRLALVQPKGGHRVGTDAALLAAAAGTPEGRIADVGAGVGAVGLALAQRSERAFADLIEIEPDLAELAGVNAQRNGLSGARPGPQPRRPQSCARAARPGSPTRRPTASSPTRRSSKRERFAPPRTRGGRGPMSCRRRTAARRSKPGFGPRSPCSSPAAGS